jgi:toxin ParE1/3/4
MRSGGPAKGDSRVPMSPPDLRLALTPQAREDYADVLLYSHHEWGAEQAARYATALAAALDRLLAFPHLGRARDDLMPGCRVHRVEQHLVVYDIRERTLRILRILHHRRDIARALREQG